MNHSTFMPHGWCMTWNPTLIGLHVVTDGLVALSYYSIPAALFILVLKKRETIPMQPLLILFGLFIAFCGGGHAIDIANIWTPLYWFKGYWNAATAATSVATAIVLIPRVHGFLKMPEMAARLQKEVQEAEERHGVLRAVMDSVVEGIVLKGANGEALVFNTAAARILGPQLDLNWPRHDLSDHDEMQLPNGRIVERFTRFIPDYGQLYVVRDLTDRLRDETARRRLEHIIATMRQGFCVISMEDQTIATPNASMERLHRYEPGTLAGQPAEVLFAGNNSERKGTLDAIIEASERESFWEGQTRGARQDGSVFFAYSRTSLHLEGFKRFLSMVEVDITEQKRLEEDAVRFQTKLMQTAKLESLGVLAGGVAHDFNNLLTGILGNASLAMDQLPAGFPVKDLLQDVVSAGERAAELTRQLLAYSGRGMVLAEALSLSDKVREINNLVKLSIPHKVRVETQLRDDLPLIYADAGQIQQLVMNLIINAAEAIGDHTGQVDVFTELEEFDPARLRQDFAGYELTPGPYVVLRVRDNGCGMDERTLSQIFDPFFTTKFTGRGLGLSATLGVVRAHNGGLHVESRLGEGTQFTVLLPPSSAKAESNLAPGARTDLNGMGLVLVVDDEEVARRAATSTLEHYGYQVLSASNGLEAIEIFTIRAREISAVLLDMTMPFMSGEEVLGRLRKVSTSVPVIMTSGYNESEVTTKLDEREIHGFLQKPYTSQALAEKIKSVWGC